MSGGLLVLSKAGEQFLLRTDAKGLPDILQLHEGSWQSLKPLRLAKAAAMRLCAERGLDPTNHTQQALRALFLFEHARLASSFFDQARW